MRKILKKNYKKIKKEDWFLKRTYLHFDYPISFNTAKSKITDVEKIKKHSFLPFLTFDITSYKYTKNPDTNKMSKKEKKRNISYASHLDGNIYSYYAKNLSEIYEQKLESLRISDCVLAFRKLEKSNVNFAKQAFDDIKKYGKCVVLALDFSKFFDNLNHEMLKNKWCKILEVDKLPDDHYNVFKSLTKFAVVNRDKVYEAFSISKNNFNSRPKRICSIKEFREKVRKEKKLITLNPNIKEKKGIPQGSSLSALLSNIYMLDFDKEINDYVNSFNGKYYRYCDDMLVIAPLDKKNQVQEYIDELVKKLGVPLNQDKTVISEFTLKDEKLFASKPLQYLGFVFDGKNIGIRSNSIARYNKKMRKGVFLAKKSMNKNNKIRIMNGLDTEPLYKKKLYERYSHLGQSTFVRYGLEANDIMQSSQIKKQMKRLWINLRNEIKLME